MLVSFVFLPLRQFKKSAKQNATFFNHFVEVSMMVIALFVNVFVALKGNNRLGVTRITNRL